MFRKLKAWLTHKKFDEASLLIQVAVDYWTSYLPQGAGATSIRRTQVNSPEAVRKFKTVLTKLLKEEAQTAPDILISVKDGKSQGCLQNALEQSQTWGNFIYEDAVSIDFNKGLVIRVRKTGPQVLYTRNPEIEILSSMPAYYGIPDATLPPIIDTDTAGNIRGSAADRVRASRRDIELK